MMKRMEFVGDNNKLDFSMRFFIFCIFLGCKTRSRQIEIDGVGEIEKRVVVIGESSRIRIIGQY